MNDRQNYAFKCQLCFTEAFADDWCMIRDKSAEHMKGCSTQEVKIYTEGKFGTVTFKKPAKKKE